MEIKLPSFVNGNERYSFLITTKFADAEASKWLEEMTTENFLHYALDLWFEKSYRKKCAGYARMICYANDFVVCRELGIRMGRFGLEVEPTKTRELEFSKFAVVWLR